MAYQGPVSDHFDGKRFRNQQPVTREANAFLKWRFTRKPIAWPNWVDIDPVQKLSQPSTEKQLQITFINHATVLIQIAGLNILTDPVWAQRCSPVQWAGPKRIHAPGIALENLPHIDLALISHNHYDHLDTGTIKQLQKRFGSAFITGLGNGELIKKAAAKAQVTELDWWQDLEINEQVTISYVPAHHWSARGLFDTNQCLWGGFVIATPDYKIYFAGDTAYGQHFKEINERFGEISLAILPIGAYEARWFMKDAHINPEEAVIAHQELQARYSLGIHFGTFADLSDEAYEQPVIDLAAAMKKHQLNSDEFRTLKPGESWQL